MSRTLLLRYSPKNGQSSCQTSLKDDLHESGRY
jgi:hypothetical protein